MPHSATLLIDRIGQLLSLLRKLGHFRFVLMASWPPYFLAVGIFLLVPCDDCSSYIEEGGVLVHSLLHSSFLSHLIGHFLIQGPAMRVSNSSSADSPSATARPAASFIFFASSSCRNLRTDQSTCGQRDSREGGATQRSREHPI